MLLGAVCRLLVLLNITDMYLPKLLTQFLLFFMSESLYQMWTHSSRGYYSSQVNVDLFFLCISQYSCCQEESWAGLSLSVHNWNREKEHTDSGRGKILLLQKGSYFSCGRNEQSCVVSGHCLCLSACSSLLVSLDTGLCHICSLV